MGHYENNSVANSMYPLFQTNKKNGILPIRKSKRTNTECHFRIKNHVLDTKNVEHLRTDIFFSKTKMIRISNFFFFFRNLARGRPTSGGRDVTNQRTGMCVYNSVLYF